MKSLAVSFRKQAELLTKSIFDLVHVFLHKASSLSILKSHYFLQKHQILILFFINHDFSSVIIFLQPVVFQLLSRVQLFSIAWPATGQASLSCTISQSLLKFMSIERVMPSNHLILCHPLLLLPSVFPSIRVLQPRRSYINTLTYSSCFFLTL